jgi:hypothetical protein
MKPRSLVLALVGAFFLPLIGYAAELSAIPFQVTSQRFESGDSIVIQEVLASSPQLKIGDTVAVRGKYHLQSRSKAALGFFLTTKGPSAPTPISPKQMSEIDTVDGTFELEHVVPSDGSLHVSFYGRPSGSSFGGVYFGPPTP